MSSRTEEPTRWLIVSTSVSNRPAAECVADAGSLNAGADLEWVNFLLASENEPEHARTGRWPRWMPSDRTLQRRANEALRGSR